MAFTTIKIIPTEDKLIAAVALTAAFGCLVAIAVPEEPAQHQENAPQTHQGKCHRPQCSVMPRTTLPSNSGLR
jgi:hypothetical protein